MQRPKRLALRCTPSAIKRTCFWPWLRPLALPLGVHGGDGEGVVSATVQRFVVSGCAFSPAPQAAWYVEGGARQGGICARQRSFGPNELAKDAECGSQRFTPRPAASRLAVRESVRQPLRNARTSLRAERRHSWGSRAETGRRLLRRAAWALPHSGRERAPRACMQ